MGDLGPIAGVPEPTELPLRSTSGTSWWWQSEYGSDPKDRPESFVDVLDQYVGQAAGLFTEERSVDQFETEWDSDRVLPQPARIRRQEDIASDAGAGDIRRDGNHVGLPDIHGKHIVGRHNHTRSGLVEVDPVHSASRYHGAERSIRSSAANDSSAVGDSAPASLASASSC